MRHMLDIVSAKIVDLWEEVIATFNTCTSNVFGLEELIFCT